MHATVIRKSIMLPGLHPAAAAALAWLALAGAVHADDHGRASVPLLPKYQQECGSCHVAYPPGMLPAASWKRLMQDLPQHFGTDASVDEVTARELSRWLAIHAGTTKRVSEAPPQDRITRSPWFLREHREVPPEAWKRASIKSPANCAACHQQAEQGDFDEHSVRIPR